MISNLLDGDVGTGISADEVLDTIVGVRVTPKYIRN